MNDWDVIPAELLQATIWCGVNFSRKSEGGLQKFPIDLKTGEAAKSNDPSTWCDFEAALAAWERGVADGLMVCLPKGIGMVDFDRIKDIAANREVRSFVRQCGSYAEYSRQGMDFIFCSGVLNRSPRRTRSCSIRASSKSIPRGSARSLATFIQIPGLNSVTSPISSNVGCRRCSSKNLWPS